MGDDGRQSERSKVKGGGRRAPRGNTPQRNKMQKVSMV